MSITEAIAEARALLPDVPADYGEDPRWQAIIRVGEYIDSEPCAVWEFICEWATSPNEDLRDAIASCLLEHLLENYFEVYFPKVAQLAPQSDEFADTFLRCWQFGQAAEPGNSRQWQDLRLRLSQT